MTVLAAVALAWAFVVVLVVGACASAAQGDRAVRRRASRPVRGRRFRPLNPA